MENLDVYVNILRYGTHVDNLTTASSKPKHAICCTYGEYTHKLSFTSNLISRHHSLWMCFSIRSFQEQLQLVSVIFDSYDLDDQLSLSSKYMYVSLMIQGSSLNNDEMMHIRLVSTAKSFV